jgi:hypothetical protein
MMRHGLVDKDQLFSSTYFEGENAGLSASGYSGYRRPDRKHTNLLINVAERFLRREAP